MKVVKKTKLVGIFVLVLCIALVATLMLACNNEDNDDPPPEGYKEFVYEAEDIDMTGLSGTGYSDSCSDWKMIFGVNKKDIRENKKVLESISGEYFINYFYNGGTILQFNVTADAASDDNTLKLRLASGWGTLDMNKNNVAIRVNGTVLDYKAFSVSADKISSPQGSSYKNPFKDFKIVDADDNYIKFPLNSGVNKIELELLDGYDFGVHIENLKGYGPGVDSLKITSKTNLTWEKLLADHMDDLAVEK